MSATLGQRIRLVRIAQGWTQKALAQRAGITAPDLCQIEREHIEPRAFTLRCLAEALEVTSDYLLGLCEEHAHQ